MYHPLPRLSTCWQNQQARVATLLANIVITLKSRNSMPTHPKK